MIVYFDASWANADDPATDPLRQLDRRAGASENGDFYKILPAEPGTEEQQMRPKRVVILGVSFGLLLGVSAFWEARDSRTPSQPSQDTAQRTENGKNSSPGDPGRSKPEKGLPYEPIETATSPSDGGFDRPRPSGSTTGVTAQEQNPPEPSDPREEPKSAKPKETGTLSVFAQPWAQVWIDRQFQGETPLELELPVGRHKVVLIYEKQETARTVTIKARKMEQLTHTW